MDLGVSGKSYVIVGGGRGMGRATAEVLAASGANVAVITRGLSGAQQAAKELSANHGIRAVGFATPGDDIGAEVVAAIDGAVNELEGIDGIAVNAGPMGRRPGVDGLEIRREEFHLLDDADWAQNYENQVMTTVRPIRALLPHLMERRAGTIVTTGAYSVHCQKPRLVHYTAMKAAIISLTKNLSATYGKHGIRANCVCPGMIETEGMTMGRDEAVATYGGTGDEALLKYANSWGMHMSLDRVGKASEVGDVYAFLLSGRGAYLTGATINVDGGTDF
jgi:NAD(P)-dependent dehydrogenase (short-subunit alcohol dehydrogenase family)